MQDGGSLVNLVDSVVSVITSDGRHIIGVLRGYDQTNNLVLDDCHERVYSTQSGVEQLPMGLYLVRGDNVAIVGELDEQMDSRVELADVRAPPLKPIAH